MTPLQFAEFALSLPSTAALCFNLTVWAQSGGRFPRWIHRLAVLLCLVGAVAGGWLATAATVNWRLALASVPIPPAAAYAGWLWLGGPCLPVASKQ